MQWTIFSAVTTAVQYPNCDTFSSMAVAIPAHGPNLCWPFANATGRLHCNISCCQKTTAGTKHLAVASRQLLPIAHGSSRGLQYTSNYRLRRPGVLAKGLFLSERLEPIFTLARFSSVPPNCLLFCQLSVVVRSHLFRAQLYCQTARCFAPSIADFPPENFPRPKATFPAAAC